MNNPISIIQKCDSSWWMRVYAPNGTYTEHSLYGYVLTYFFDNFPTYPYR